MAKEKRHHGGKDSGGEKAYAKDPSFKGTDPKEDKQPKEGPHGGHGKSNWDGTGVPPKNIAYPTNVYPTDIWDNHKDKD